LFNYEKKPINRLSYHVLGIGLNIFRIANEMLRLTDEGVN